LYLADDDKKSVDIVKSGTLTFGGVPFNVLTPERSPSGKNVINLKGGARDVWAYRTMPASVEIKGGGFKANRLHFLGGIGGWAFPFNRDNFVVMKAIVHYVGGDSETLEFRNGVEFADHIARNDVPGSTFAEGVSKGFQVRWFSKQLAKGGAIDKIVLESTASGVAPTTLAVTAELADANAKPLPTISAAAAPAAPAAPAKAEFVPQFSDPVPQPPKSTDGLKGPRVLLVGGGSSHDFVKFFGATDKAFLADIAGWIDFTQNANGVPAIMKDLDVLVWSANQPIASETAKALTEWVNAGKPLVLLHPGTWYLWKNFPEWNSVIAGGGARGHDSFGEFEVNIENRAHPITAGVTDRFKITDELYYFMPDPKGTPIEVLATATSPKDGRTFPQVFIVKHEKARIVGITLGHDAKAHDLPEFQKLLKQAILWAAGKTEIAAK
jgi:type 1 glutamine amidotransferase